MVTTSTPNTRSNKAGRTTIWLLLAALWIAALFGGFRALWAYQTTAGASATGPATWPDNSGLTIARDTPTLVMIMHPLCPCWRASVHELSKLMSRGGLSAYVIVTGSAVERDPSKTDAFAGAAAIKGVHAVADPYGRLLQQFPAATSGQVFLYDEEGRLRFSGGITAGRGHEGFNAGSAAISRFVRHHRIERSTTSVFGCAIEKRNGARS